ncbi:MAG: phosphatidylglycerophosphatase A [Lentisphaerales bacterium]|jgi:phosphatidylglycerophosphatase A|nr:MAG: phosphatidylglycerophosphatase A [Lentisphaerales bacterium]
MNRIEWKDCRLVRKVSLLLATGFGLGLSPVASGTVGTLPGILIVVGTPDWGLAPEILLALLWIVLAVPLCGIAEEHFRVKDDGRIVADEYMTFPLVLIGLPWRQFPILLVMAFVTHRLFDILKPPPARGIQKLTGGLGIVADDAISGLYALALNHILFRLFF